MTAADIIRSKVTLYFHSDIDRFLKRIGMSRSSYYRRLANPLTISVSELKRITAVLHLSEDEIAEIIRKA